MYEWEKLIEKGYRDIGEVKEKLNLTADEVKRIQKIEESYPMFVNPYYFSLIRSEDPRDPIRKLCIPSVEEARRCGSFDTSGEASNTVIAGLQHKYRETALILSTNQCAMYCRHCFRKRLVGLSEEEISKELESIFTYIREHTELSNVLISGGDAFMNSNQTIRTYLEGLSGIGHLDLIRFGTRTPVVLPQRITTDTELKSILKEYSGKKRIYVVTQFNHPREVTREAVNAVEQLLEIGIPVKNQTVLLRGINDDPEVLGTLLKQLTRAGVIPYYIFQCRPVTGVMSHFQVPLREGYHVVETAKQMQNGQGKCFRYALSHPTGKIEILGPLNKENMIFKYHQAKDVKDQGRIFCLPVSEEQCWLN